MFAQSLLNLLGQGDEVQMCMQSITFQVLYLATQRCNLWNICLYAHNDRESNHFSEKMPYLRRENIVNGYSILLDLRAARSRQRVATFAER